jgi:signal transduction histidine kinase
MQAGLAAGFGTHLAARAPLPGLLCRMIDALPGLAVLVGRDQLDGPWLLLHAHAVQTHAGGRQRLCPAGPPYEELAGALQAWPDWPARLILDTLGGKHHDSAETACGTPTPPATGTAQALVRILPLDAHCAVVWLPPPAAPADPAPEMTTAAAAAATAAARAAAAAQSDAERDAFLFSVSHDLRAPIRVIDGFTRILKEDYGAALDRIGNDHLDRVLGASARMSAMIDALLGLSRLSTRALQRVSVDLSEMAEQVMDELRRQAPQRRAQIIIQPGMTVQGDPTLLRTVLDNLLGNAWKYSARRELTRIELGAGTDDAGRRIFRVSDNGAGFDMRFAERLFGPFQRLHSASEFVGTGVGLASVRRIVHRHGGDIWAQAEVDRGATFCFTLGD